MPNYTSLLRSKFIGIELMNREEMQQRQAAEASEQAAAAEQVTIKILSSFGRRTENLNMRFCVLCEDF